MVEELEVKKIPISLIKFDDTNPNILSKDQMNALKLTMEKFGYLAPVILNKDFTVVDGEHRVRIYQELDKKEIQAYVIDVDTIDLKILRQLMNKLRGEHDKQKDSFEFKSIYDAGRLDEFTKLLAQPREEFEQILSRKFDVDFIKEDQEVPEINRETNVKLGDIYQLGNHRIMCGDSTKDMDKLLGDKTVDLLLTDPPYNIGFRYNGIDDKQSKEEYFKLCESIFNQLKCNKIITPGPQNLDIWFKIQKPNDIGIWLKRNSRSGASAFHFRRCEPILFYGKFNKRDDDVFDFSMEKYSELSDIQYQKGVGESHAPAKPLKFWQELVNYYTDKGNLILDTFLGTGTTLIICEASNRICYGMELDPYYIDVIITRWENYTGKKAIKISSNTE